MALVLKLFLQCRTGEWNVLVVSICAESVSADTVPLQQIQSLILDLLQDASEATMSEASLAEVRGTYWRVRMKLTALSFASWSTCPRPR
jgi:hypothetical protein